MSGIPLYRDPHFRELNIEVSSFQGVGIEEFHCIQRPVSSFQGVGIEWVPLYTEVSSLQGIRIEDFIVYPKQFCHFIYR